MFIKSYFKLLLSFLFHLIKNNPVKMIVVLTTIILGNLAGSFEPYEIETQSHIVNKFQDGDKIVYVTKSNSGSDFKYETLIRTEEIEIDENGYYHYIEYDDINVLFYILFGIGILWIIAGIFATEGDFNFKYNWREALLSLVNVELENDTYYYMALGRLVGKSDKSLTWNALSNFGVKSLRDIYLCPKYELKHIRRNNILSKLGIN